ncbi:alpha-1,2-fucosyltransferase [Flavicella sp.]|uniref:alpha-1,2-fucosyltransferase n=1 Tax=Flavicella sp. TaxID=2957742 RepID=UPI00301731C2
MTDFNILGRPDGLGNRMEEIILVSAFSSKENQCFNYIWNNKFKNRRYDINFTSENVKISKESNKNIPIKTLNELELNLLTQDEILRSAKNINPTFKIHFENEIKPIGVHIRGSDRINNNDHPHFMKNKEEFFSYLEKAIETINKKFPKYIFVCADDPRSREIFIDNLNSDITVINPVYDDSIKNEYVDFFSLSLCTEIYMCSKFSTFAITASMIGNIPLIAFQMDRDTAKRYKALFQYELNIPHNDELYLSITENYPNKSPVSKRQYIENRARRLLTQCKNAFYTNR